MSNWYSIHPKSLKEKCYVGIFTDTAVIADKHFHQSLAPVISAINYVYGCPSEPLLPFDFIKTVILGEGKLGLSCLFSLSRSGSREMWSLMY